MELGVGPEAWAIVRAVAGWSNGSVPVLLLFIFMWGMSRGWIAWSGHLEGERRHRASQERLRERWRVVGHRHRNRYAVLDVDAPSGTQVVSTVRPDPPKPQLVAFGFASSDLALPAWLTGWFTALPAPIRRLVALGWLYGLIAVLLSLIVS